MIAETTTVTQRETVTRDEEKPYLVTHQILDFILFLIQGFLLLMFVLRLTGANPAAGFVQFVYGIAGVLMIPFRYIFPVVSAGEAVFDWSILVAMLVYGLIFYAIRKAVGVAHTADTA